MTENKKVREKQAADADGGRFGLVVAVIVLVVANVVTFSVMQSRLLRVRGELAQCRVEMAKAVADRSLSVEAAQPPAAGKPDEALEVVVRDRLGDFQVINAHEHLYMRKHLDKYLAACKKLGIVKTVFVGSSNYTMTGKGPQDEGNDWNNREILYCEGLHPDAIDTFVTFHPDETDMMARLSEYIALGAVGVKLYTGHGNFHDRPLDVEEMMPLYAYCEANGIPLCWHVNMSRESYAAEFRRVMEKFPRLKVIIPHFGVTFYRPGEPAWDNFWKLLDEYPGIYTDCSWGTRKILTHGLEMVSMNVDLFREIFNRYQDRIMWGTDMVVTGNREKTQDWIEDVLRAGRDMLEQDTCYFSWAKEGHPNAAPGFHNADGMLKGLDLPDDILHKVYETNYPAFMNLKLN